ncbi:MAG: bile acid:sodium symporter [Alistipes sp.]|nr:bile acid:sodium symporter [Alistipes sp.]
MTRPRNIRTFAMPIGMIVGALLCRPITALEEWGQGMIMPVLIFAMLFLTYCKVDMRRMRLSWLHLWLLIIQFVGSVGIFYALSPLGEIVAQGAMMCVLAPIAMAAVVIGGMLGADTESMTAFSLLCNLSTALVAPYILHLAGGEGCTLIEILSKVAPLLILPFIAGQACRYIVKPVARWAAENKNATFYIWLIALIIIIGRTTSFVIDQQTENIKIELIMAGISLIICLVQFGIGRWLGRKYGDAVAGGQSLGQKNTVLAIWMSQTFLNPLSSVAPTAYILWQNMVNSWQLYRQERDSRKQ